MHEQIRRGARANRRAAGITAWLVFAVVVLVVIVAGLVAGFVIWRSTADEVPDFAGQGDTEVVIRVQSGDSIGDIAKTLADAGVVASTEAFQNQAALDADVQALRPGYYKVRQNASAQATADALVAKENRVGHVRLIPGRQLADVTAVSTDPTAAAGERARLHLRDHRRRLRAAERGAGLLHRRRAVAGRGDRRSGRRWGSSNGPPTRSGRLRIRASGSRA